MLYSSFNKSFMLDTGVKGPMTWKEVQQEIRGGKAEFTFTGVAVGTGHRTAMDRDRDNTLDGDESVVLYGMGTEGCAGVPVIGVSSPPKIGNANYATGRTFLDANPDIEQKLELATQNIEIKQRFYRPVSVHVDANGKVFVADCYRHRVQIYQKL